MGTRRRLNAAPLVLALAVAGTLGCKRKEQEAPPGPAPSAAPGPDRLAKGEIPEGRERAFTLPLPLYSTVKARFGNSVHVGSPHTQEELANFVKTRVKDGQTTTGTSETRFDRVVVAKDPSKTLTIHVRPAPLAGEFKSQLVVTDITAPPEDPGTTDADRWKKAGMTPDGKLIDPKHMQ